MRYLWELENIYKGIIMCKFNLKNAHRINMCATIFFVFGVRHYHHYI
jgi:hypothetical protein